MDVKKTADAISATLQGQLQSFYIRQPGEPLVEQVETVTALILNGLTGSKKAESNVSEKKTNENCQK